MKTGRPPAWALDQADGAGGAIEVRPVDSRGRFTLPARILSLLPWAETTENCTCLLVLDAPGLVRVMPWEPFGPKIIEERRKAIQLSDQESVLRLDDRYLRTSIVMSRVGLPDLAIAHLDSGRAVSTIYLVVTTSELQIWSVSYRNRNRTRLGAHFDELP